MNISIFQIKRGMIVVTSDGKEYKVKEVQQSFIEDSCIVYVVGNKEIKLNDIVLIR